MFCIYLFVLVVGSILSLFLAQNNTQPLLRTVSEPRQPDNSFNLPSVLLEHYRKEMADKKIRALNIIQHAFSSSLGAGRIEHLWEKDGISWGNMMWIIFYRPTGYDKKQELIIY